MDHNEVDTKERLADAVFEGGGVKGIALVGALAVAEEAGYHWSNVAGTSAGAIVAALVAAGYSASELKEIMDSLDFRRMMDQDMVDRIPLVGPLISLGWEKGIYEGHYLEELIRTHLAAKGVHTFRDLVIPEFADEERYRYRLRVIASDISRGRLLVLPQDIAKYGVAPDDLDVALAVRMSMSIPFFFEPIKLRDVESGEESYIVDGGLLSNFPVWLFDSPGEPAWPTFGFHLVEDVHEVPGIVRHPIRGPLSLLAALFFTMMEAHDARYIEDQDFVRTIPIPTLGVNATDFDLSSQQKDALYASGQEAARRFFQHWDFPTYVARYRRDTSRHGRRLELI